jgi:DedD protein
LQTQLKERLTGAALLVLIVVLLVPEMFRGRPASAPRTASSALEGPPVRSYTIDLRDNDAAQPLPSGAPLSATTPQSAGATPPTEAPPVVAPAAAATGPAVSGKSADVPQSAAPLPAAIKPQSSSPPIAAPAIPTPAHAAAGAGWTVQVGSFARRDFADRMVRQMKAKGFAVQVAGPDDKGLYRVRSAVFADRARALALRQQMQQKGLKPIVNALP